MKRFVECPICGLETLQVWKEKHEAWGRPVYEDMEECQNPLCGEEDNQDEAED